MSLGPPSHWIARPASLNSNPHNLRAEELAMEECMLGVDVRRSWTEVELVKSLGGRQFPGTPDGMFEDWDGGHLTCVQVVRVPLNPGMITEVVAEVLYYTVLTKVVKSQIWMKATQLVPREFIIFCWLPPFPEGHHEASAERAQALVERVRAGGWPFYLRLMVPAEPGGFFPALFAYWHSGRECFRRRKGRLRSISESDLSTFAPSNSASTENQEAPEWDAFADTDMDDDSMATSEIFDFDIFDGHLRRVTYR
eukprot:gnl/TRDRNA2_/TRDRNA2_83569_c1_seq1.p1 gnl/TRDRNA2_/TRDRNA2_83569_c1~~gnl/TRDRNA2_/TRDRNA2_83569_c1_seq1.p1  ORF type:complete len:253 (+),score=44.70 gnl/TRDRNA2_/TRDRNA2_83569_c1_seq1:114-872(+)